MNALQDLSVIYAITPDPFWRKAARVSSRSLGRFTPPGEVKIVEYQGGRRRGGAYSRKYPPYTQGARSWTLALDADLVVTEDLTELFERVRASGCRVAIRESKLTSRPSFKPDAYRSLFGRAGLPFRQIGQTCAFFIETELAKALMPTVSRWRLWVDRRVSSCTSTITTPRPRLPWGWPPWA